MQQETNYDLEQGLLGEKLKHKTQKSVEARTQTIYKNLLELCEKASENGSTSIKIYASEETAALFKDKRVYKSVSKLFKSEGIVVKMYTVSLFNDRTYITIAW